MFQTTNQLLFGVWLGTDCWWLGLEEILQESPLLLPPNEGHFAGTNSGIRKISRTTTKDWQYNLQNGYGVHGFTNNVWKQSWLGTAFFSNQGNHKLCLSKHRERHKTSINGDILGLYSTYIYMYIYTVYYVNKPASFNIRTCVHQNGNVHKKSWSLPLDFRAYFRPQGDATL